MKYGSLKIKSNWFEPKKGSRKILKIGYKGLDMYFSLAKFRLRGLEDNILFTFQTSISQLRTETSFSSKEIIELLKLLSRNKIIKLNNPSKWSQLLDASGKLKDKELLIITATDVPQTNKIFEDGKSKDEPNSEDDYYISIDLDMFEFYKALGLDRRYFPLYCLMRKYSNGVEAKCTMTIENMADVLGIHKDTLHGYIKDMNAKHVLHTRLLSNGKKGKKSEHKLCGSLKNLYEFERTYGEEMDSYSSKWNKPSEKIIYCNGTESQELLFDNEDHDPTECNTDLGRIDEYEERESFA